MRKRCRKGKGAQTYEPNDDEMTWGDVCVSGPHITVTAS
jgi:hypothetical protein